MEEKQWQYGMNIVFGILLFVMPWLLGFETVIPLRSWDFFVIGVAIVGFAALAMHMRSRMGEWASLILGIWMFVSPWVLGFIGNIPARNAAWVLGVMVFLLSLWARVERTQTQRGTSGARAGSI